MQLNAEGFVDEVLFFSLPKELNDIFEDFEKGYYATNLINLSVPYGLHLVQAQICIGYFLQEIGRILNKPIEQIGENKLTDLLDSGAFANLRNDFIEFVKNNPIEDIETYDLQCEKIARLYIAMPNWNMQNELSSNFSRKVFSRTIEFLASIINNRKVNEINCICNMIDNLSLDNNTDDTRTKYTKLVAFFNAFMFRKNNVIEFIDDLFNQTIISLNEIAKNGSYAADITRYKFHFICKNETENCAKLVLDYWQTLERPINPNSLKKLNELLDPEKLNNLKRKLTDYIIDCGSKFYVYNSIDSIKEWDYEYYPFFDDSFDTETPLDLRNMQKKQINTLIGFLNCLNNEKRFSNFFGKLTNIINFLNRISNLIYDEAAIKSVLNLNSAKILIEKKSAITIDDINNFTNEFNKIYPHIMQNPIPQQENSMEQQNSK